MTGTEIAIERHRPRIPKNLGDKVHPAFAALYQAAGYRSLYELCKKTGLPLNTVYRYANGSISWPREAQLKTLAGYLNVSPYALLSLLDLIRKDKSESKVVDKVKPQNYTTFTSEKSWFNQRKNTKSIA